MDSNYGGEEVAPLVVMVVDGSPVKSHAGDIHIFSFAFLFISSAYHAAQNLENTMNTQALGTTSLGVLYTSFTLFSVVTSSIVHGLGSKRALLLGSSGYLLFIASNLVPSWLAWQMRKQCKTCTAIADGQERDEAVAGAPTAKVKKYASCVRPSGQGGMP